MQSWSFLHYLCVRFFTSHSYCSPSTEKPTWHAGKFPPGTEEKDIYYIKFAVKNILIRQRGNTRRSVITGFVLTKTHQGFPWFLNVLIDWLVVTNLTIDKNYVKLVKLHWKGLLQCLWYDIIVNKTLKLLIEIMKSTFKLEERQANW